MYLFFWHFYSSKEQWDSLLYAKYYVLKHNSPSGHNWNETTQYHKNSAGLKATGSHLTSISPKYVNMKDSYHVLDPQVISYK